MNVDELRKFLEDGKWPYDRITEDTFRSRFERKGQAFPFFVRVDPRGFLTATVVPFVRSPKQSAEAKPLYDRLLRLNHDLLMAKFSIDDDLDVVLSAEYPIRDLDPSEFRDAIDALSYYATEYYAELAALAAE